MAPKDGKKGGKKGKGSKEDQERLAREEAEREARELSAKQEQEAEERQRLENELRDKLEYKEKKRLKKEAQAQAMAEKDAAIAFLSKSLNDLNRNHESMKTEMEDELERMTHLKEALENELSQTQIEHDQTTKNQLDERESAAAQILQLEDDAREAKRRKDELEQELQEKNTELNKQLTQTTAECQLLRSSKEQMEADLTDQVNTQNKELSKAQDLNKTLQEVIAVREEEDKKNTVLMQLLNTQLEDQKTRFEELLGDEQEKTKGLQKELMECKQGLLKTETERDTFDKDLENLKRDSQTEIKDISAKLEQHKFDTKFLHSELNIYKSKLTKQQAENEKMEKGAAKDVGTLRSELEDAGRLIEQLEETIRRKDRDHFDKVTFLNAQISNNRITISGMHSKIQTQKENHLQELSEMNDEVSAKSERLVRVQNASDSRTLKSTESEVKMTTDLASLKTAVFQLQSALVAKERELNEISHEKDLEIHRLRRKLDEEFIPHRREAWDRTGGEAASPGSLAGTHRMTMDMDGTTKVREEVETRMNQQIGNLNSIIESLQTDLRNKEDDSYMKMRLLNDENSRLRKTLDTLELEDNFVPFRTS